MNDREWRGPADADVYIVDAFTAGPFTGNPAGVCLSDEAPDDRWMQAFAAELGFSETAFAHGRGKRRTLRWFTPTVEVDLCGHATLAAACAVWEQSGTDVGRAAFETRSGCLTARRDGATGRIVLDFPVETPVPLSPDVPVPDLEAALGLATEPVSIAANRFDLLVEVRDEATVRSLDPGHGTIAALPYRGLIVTARAATATREACGADFVSRYFAPAVGVDEDPVTGSSHCALGPWWAERFGREELVGLQVSKRSGLVYVRVGSERILLGGHAEIVVRGRLVQGRNR